MTAITDLLNQIENGLSIAGVPSMAHPGQPFTAGVAPALVPLTLTTIEPQPFSLDFIAKNVVFQEKDFTQPDFVTDTDIVKIMPLFNVATLPPQLDGSGVPGLIGKLTGDLPVPVATSAVPTMIRLTWEVLDENGQPLAEGTDFLAPDGLNQPTATIIMLPVFERFDGQFPAPKLRQLRLTGMLDLAGESIPLSLGPVPALVPVIPFPQALALTLHNNFQGAALVMVSGNSGVNSLNHLKDLLNPVRSAIQTLTSIARFAAMLTGIDTLTAVLDAANIEFFKGDTLKNLNDITLIQRAWYENDTEAEDELSSFVYVSPPPDAGSEVNKVAMFNDRDLESSEGRFVVTTGLNFVALCRALDAAAPTVEPNDASLVVTHAADDWNTDDFGDELSSIQFL